MSARATPHPLGPIVEDVLDMTDVVRLAGPESAAEFRLASTGSGVAMFTKPVPSFPVHCMKGQVTMPCTPKEFLSYLELNVRKQWDDLLLNGHIVEHIVTHKAPVAAAEGTATVQTKYMAFASPIRGLFKARDFELVVGERMLPDGTAILKAVSPPAGTVVPLVPAQYVRGEVRLSGFVAKPATVSDGRGGTVQHCEVTYVALVHPRGNIPTLLVNAVIGKQSAALVRLRTFIEADQRARQNSGDTRRMAAKL
jgi:hypothetical protein